MTISMVMWTRTFAISKDVISRQSIVEDALNLVLRIVLSSLRHHVRLWNKQRFVSQPDVKTGLLLHLPADAFPFLIDFVFLVSKMVNAVISKMHIATSSVEKTAAWSIVNSDAPKDMRASKIDVFPKAEAAIADPMINLTSRVHSWAQKDSAVPDKHVVNSAS